MNDQIQPYVIESEPYYLGSANAIALFEAAALMALALALAVRSFRRDAARDKRA